MPRRRARFAWATAGLLVALATGCGCVAPPDPGRLASTPPARQPVAAESWDRDGLAAAQPCLLALSEGPDAALRAIALDGRILADQLWKPPGGTTATLLDANERGPRVAVAIGGAESRAPADFREEIVVLGRDGAVVAASAAETSFPLVSCAVLLGKDDLLWLRRRETPSAVETRIGLADLETGSARPVALSGKWPSHRFVASLVALGSPTRVAVVLKVDGSPAPHDDFAVVLAEYRDGKLVAESRPYLDDPLFTLSRGPEPDTLCYVRAGSRESSTADQIVALEPREHEWVSRVLLRDANCDPGFDRQHVVGRGPDSGVLFRPAAAAPSAVSSSGTPAEVSESLGRTARLRLLLPGAASATDTGVRLDRVGDQWVWVGAAIR